jgi:hypothetical protein
MKIYGAVLAILDETKVLLKMEKSEYVPDGRIVTVFSEIKDPTFERFGLEKVLIPKGELEVLVAQGEGVYVAQRFQSERVEKRRKPSNLMLNPLGQFFGEEVEVITKGSWSATFDQSQSMKLAYPKEIQVGDSVGEK